jgi:hypothetical protein
MAKYKAFPVTKADKEEFVEFFINLLDKGKDEEYYFSKGEARVLALLGIELPTFVSFSTNDEYTNTIKLALDEEKK